MVNMANTTYCFLTYETLEQCTVAVNALNGNWLGDVATSRLSATLAKDRDNQTYPKARFGPGGDQTGTGGVVLREAGRGNGAPAVPTRGVAVAGGVPEAAVAEPNSTEAVPPEPASAAAAVAEPASTRTEAEAVPPEPSRTEAAVAEPAGTEAAVAEPAGTEAEPPEHASASRSSTEPDATRSGTETSGRGTKDSNQLSLYKV